MALQLHLAARFRRLVNPALAAATVLAIAFAAVTVTRLNAESGRLDVAKQDAFDSIQALTLARAVSYDANADESRYLVDPGRAAQYQQSFLAKSQQIVNVGPVGISGYDAALAADIAAYQRDNSDVRFGGYLGAEFRNITFPGERRAAVATLLAFQRLRAGRPHAARPGDNEPGGTRSATTPEPPRASPTGRSTSTTRPCRRSSRSTRAPSPRPSRDGEDGAVGWEVGFPALGLVLIATLTLAGIRPRLAEYR